MGQSLQANLPAAALPLQGADNGLRHARVLVAEDNAVNLEVACFHLEDLDCSAVTAVNGAIAVSLVEQGVFDFVLMDCQMPLMDGFQALDAIRALETRNSRRRCVILAVTADDDAQSRAKCAAAGFDGFLAKPFSQAQLERALLDCRDNRASSTHMASTAGAAVEAPGSIIDKDTYAAFVADFGAETAGTLVQSFVKSLHEGKQRYVVACATQDTQKLQSLAHKIAGAAGTVGAMTLVQSARAIDGACKRGQFKWTTEIAQFGSCLDATIAVFERLPGGMPWLPTSDRDNRVV